MSAAVGLEIGKAVRLGGRYVLHWEVSRFEFRRRRWLAGTCIEWCELVPAEGVAANPLAALGRELPDDWRHQPGLAFDVIVDAVPIERGHFGHRGWLRWRLRVERWVAVRPVV